MSDDWKPGDLALCVKGSRDFVSIVNTGRTTPGPRNGQILTVEAVDSKPAWYGMVGLRFPNFAVWFEASNFRKIHPHTPDAEDIETIELLTGKPATVNA